MRSTPPPPARPGLRGAMQQASDALFYETIEGLHQVHRTATRKHSLFGPSCNGRVGALSDLDNASLIGSDGARYDIGLKVTAKGLVWTGAGSLEIGSHSSVENVQSVGDTTLSIGRRVKANDMKRWFCGPTTLHDGADSERMTHTGSGPLSNGGNAHDTRHASSGFMNILPGAEFVNSRLESDSNVIAMPGAKVSDASVMGGGTTVFCGDVKSHGGMFYTPKGFISIIKGDIGDAGTFGSVIFPVEEGVGTAQSLGRTTYTEQHSDSNVDAALGMDWSALPLDQRRWVKNALLAVRAVGDDIDTIKLSDALGSHDVLTWLPARTWATQRFAQLPAEYTRHIEQADGTNGSDEGDA